jgi:protocatechuate 3,4-dioxygenase alpha subunit
MSRAALGQTPSQTVGPYFAMRLGGEDQHVLAGPATPGRHVRIEGRVLDGDGAFIEDALVEVWQADAEGRYLHPDDRWDDPPADDRFTGFGRARTDFATGDYVIETILPGSVPGPDGRPQAPHLNLIVQARGMLMPSFTRCYFEDAADANAVDPILALVPEERRATLMASLEDADADPARYRFDIRFGGDAETVFFDF